MQIKGVIGNEFHSDSIRWYGNRYLKNHCLIYQFKEFHNYLNPS